MFRVKNDIHKKRNCTFKRSGHTWEACMPAIRVLLAILLVICPVFDQIAHAGQTALHVVSEEALRAAVAARISQRASHIDEIQKLLGHELVQKQIGQLVDLVRIERALSQLDDQTLSQLAAESRKVNDQFQAGVHTAVWVAIIAGIAIFLLIIAATATAGG